MDSGKEKVPVDAFHFPTIFVPLCPIEQLIQNVFPQIATNYENLEWPCELVILAAKNNKSIIQGQILGKYATYKLIDTIMSMEKIVNYPTEFFNSLDIPGVSQYVLSIKIIGAPKIILRNINPPRMCNGTRLAVKKN